MNRRAYHFRNFVPPQLRENPSDSLDTVLADQMRARILQNIAPAENDEITLTLVEHIEQLFSQAADSEIVSIFAASNDPRSMMLSSNSILTDALYLDIFGTTQLETHEWCSVMSAFAVAIQMAFLKISTNELQKKRVSQPKNLSSLTPTYEGPINFRVATEYSRYCIARIEAVRSLDNPLEQQAIQLKEMLGLPNELLHDLLIDAYELSCDEKGCLPGTFKYWNYLADAENKVCSQTIASLQAVLTEIEN